ncbi:glycerol-3-phosphate 1-O-acyltransferase PlsY [Mycoplasmopsis edwardii]|uniref:Glycerol-3-phosphate 1-O-acyltransferase PlsY n=1 Tax=Mycoplasmopsis edwardii TaxID=53558 RepID=A0ACD4PH94_9BACT|nr:glycerol-3-phosphate 1-O-acyltransferase PlsY [Mycoplasmopsis edwardii]WBP84039.1 glycerol-3-phosphate 1-O-acyltransferase PlsY [Mycoplasmopsis edwardii]
MDIFLTIILNLGFFLVGYLFGSLNTSILFGKITKKPDLREHHSKNAGATNSLRVYGVNSAVIILLLDVLKTILIVLLCRLIMKAINSSITPEFITKSKNVSLIQSKLFLIPLLGGIGVIVGNIYPVFYKFKGGKGVATSIGLLISINITLLPIAAVFFFGFMFWKKYVSLASISTAFLMIFFVGIPWMSEGILGWMTGIEKGYFWIALIIFVIDASLIIFAHRENIKRLLNKSERKFITSKK